MCGVYTFCTTSSLVSSIVRLDCNAVCFNLNHYERKVMIGERAVVGPSGIIVRPIIRLQDNAVKFQGGSGAGGDGHSRPVVDFTMTTNPSHPTEVSGINFNQLFRCARQTRQAFVSHSHSLFTCP